jgi:hypothetical protein
MKHIRCWKPDIFFKELIASFFYKINATFYCYNLVPVMKRSRRMEIEIGIPDRSAVGPFDCCQTRHKLDRFREIWIVSGGGESGARRGGQVYANDRQTKNAVEIVIELLSVEHNKP